MPVEPPFEEFSRLAQVRRLRQVALSALDDYDVRPSRVRLLAHEHNTTFRVDTADGTRYALRVNVNSYSDEANIDAETAWMAALARDTDVVVPAPLATVDGRLHTSRWSRHLGRELRVVVMSWLPGRDLGRPSIGALVCVGALMATMHDHAEHWSPPSGARFPSSAAVLFGDVDRMHPDGDVVTPTFREVIDAAIARTQGHLDNAFARSTPHAIHADLHGGNLKWRNGRLAVFDFDDAMWGVPLQDLGIAAYYLRATDVDERPLLDGYAAVRSLPPFEPPEFEAILAGRNLLLLNDVLGAVSAGTRAIRAGYAANSRLRLQHFLDHGEYRFDVPGVRALHG